MERFLERHYHRITGTLSGFDRVLFRGTLRSIAHVKGLTIFLYSQQVLFKDFGDYAQSLSQQIVEHAKSMAATLKRPYEYLPSSQVSKEELALQIMKRDSIQQGLICVFSCVEPCQSFDLRKDAKAKQLKLVSKERKCLHLYFYYLDREFGLMHVRLQTWLPFTIQVCVNGREWLARHLPAAGLAGPYELLVEPGRDVPAERPVGRRLVGVGAIVGRHERVAVGHGVELPGRGGRVEQGHGRAGDRRSAGRPHRPARVDVGDVEDDRHGPAHRPAPGQRPA